LYQQRRCASQKWLEVTIASIVGEVEAIPSNEPDSPLFLGPNLALDKPMNFESICLPLHTMLRTSPEQFMQQLCLFDANRLSQVNISEFVNKSWVSTKKKQLAPNLCYLAEAPTRLSRFITFSLLVLRNVKTVEALSKRLLDVVELLIDNHNY
jgi:hypothetical protein